MKFNDDVPTDDDVLGVAAAISDIAGTAGYAALMMLLRRERDAAARRFLMDDTTSKDYARGYQAGLTYLAAQSLELAQAAEDIKAEREAEKTFSDARIAGSGNGSLA